MRAEGASDGSVAGTLDTACPIDVIDDAAQWAGMPLYLHSQPVQDHTEQLYPEELSLISGAAQRRRNTFSTARCCARALMPYLGLPPAVLPRRSDGSVQWPEQVIGSLSHTDEWAVAVIARRDCCKARAIGADLERIRPLDAGVIRLIATPAEQQELARNATCDWLAVALFSLKESLYKCLARDFGRFINFHDVECHDLVSGHPVIHMLNTQLQAEYDALHLQVRMSVSACHVFTLIWLHE